MPFIEGQTDCIHHWHQIECSVTINPAVESECGQMTLIEHEENEFSIKVCCKCGEEKE